MPALIEPPGEMMYSAMSFSLSAEASRRSCAQIRLVTSSLTSLPRKMIRSRSSRSKTWSSKDAPPERIEIPSTVMALPSPTGPLLSQPFTCGRIRCRHNRRVPEGHTIHRLAARHRELFAGQRVALSSPQGRFAAGAQRLTGRILIDTEAYGKHLLHHFEGGLTLHVHLGLYGRFTDGAPPPPAPIGQVRMRMVSDRHWLDLRGPTACEVLDPVQVEALRARLGADPLRDDADPGPSYRKIGASTRPIFALLLDQSIIAGCGLIYANEVLFRAGLAPTVPGRQISPQCWSQLWDDLRALMKEGVARGR